MNEVEVKVVQLKVLQGELAGWEDILCSMITAPTGAQASLNSYFPEYIVSILFKPHIEK